MKLPTLPDAPHLAEVVPSVLNALGVAEASNTLSVPECSGACVLLVDGLGWELLAEHAADAPVLAELARSPLRVGFPATTAAGLAAVGTGAASGAHGMVGYTFALPGTGVLNALRWCAHPEGADLREVAVPEDVQPLPTMFTLGVEAGLTVRVVSGAQFAGSGLTRATQRGCAYVGVRALGDLSAEIARTLQERSSFCYAYHPDLDMMGHLYGPGSPAWRAQLRYVDKLVESIMDALPAGGMLTVVADHGMVTIDDSALDVDELPELRAGVRAIGGEVRARHVYVTEGAEHDVRERWRGVLGDRAWVVSREEAIESGWFGPVVADRVRPRIGDVVVAARGQCGLLRRGAEPVESSFLGQHGSLTAAEQLVPMATAYG